MRDQAIKLVSAAKGLAGIPRWVSPPRQRAGGPSDWHQLQVTLSMDGQPVPALRLRGQAHPHYSPQRLQLMLEYGDFALERISLHPTMFHTSRVPGIPARRLPPGAPRRYRLHPAEPWPPPRSNRYAEPIESPLVDAAAAIEFALKTWAIAGHVPLPDYMPRLFP